MRHLRPTLAVLCTAAFISLPALGQQQQQAASLSGLVTDTQGGTIAVAHITLSFPSGTRLLDASTDASGRFELNGLVSGSFSIRVVANGFASLSKPITVAGNVRLEEVYTLRIATANTTVVVTRHALSAPSQTYPPA